MQAQTASYSVDVFIDALAGLDRALAAYLRAEAFEQLDKFFRVGREYLIRGSYFYLFDIVGTALSFDIEIRHAVYLVAPELKAAGIFLAGREEIEHAAAYRVLTRSVDLRRTGVARTQQCLYYRLKRHLVADFKLERAVFELLGRESQLRRSLRRADHRLHLAAQHLVEHAESPVLVFARLTLC